MCVCSASRHVSVRVGVRVVPLHVVALDQRLDALLDVGGLQAVAETSG